MNKTQGWSKYYVRWHIAYDSANDIHTIQQAGFSDEDSASSYYNQVSTAHAKKLVTPVYVSDYSAEWAQYIPGGSWIKPFAALWHKGYNNGVSTIQIKYFDDEASAASYYNGISANYAKKLVKPYEVLHYSAAWASYLP